MTNAEYENMMSELRSVNVNLEKLGALLQRIAYPPQQMISYDGPIHWGNVKQQ